MKLFDETSYRQGIEHLSQADQDLQSVIERYGPPPEWTREPGFATLVRIILEQKVSLAAAAAVYRRLLSLIGPLTPENFVLQPEDRLYALGVSRRKIIYCRELARSIIDQQLDLRGLTCLSDQEAIAELKKIKGIGQWTATIYLLMCLRRLDVWPLGDLALIQAVSHLKGIDHDRARLETISDPWRPYRSIAARICWHYYLRHPTLRGPKGKPGPAIASA